MKFGIAGAKTGFSYNDPNRIDFSIDSENISPKIWRPGKKIVDANPYTFDHGWGYAPAFAGYIKNGSKYFLNFANTPVVGDGFENTIFGQIRATDSQILATCTTLNALRYLLFVDQSSSVNPLAAKNPPNLSRIGIKIAPPGVSIQTAKDYQLVFRSDYQTPLIVQIATLSVTLPQQTVADGAVYTTNAVADFTHKLGYPAHLIVFRDSNAMLAANNAALHAGGTPPYLRPEEEISIDSSIVRYRVSGQYVGANPIFGTGSSIIGPMTFIIKVFITQVALP